jgi:hypothetical protein
MLTIAGMIFNPSFVARYLSPDSVIEKPTIIEIYIFEAYAITLGFIVWLYSLVKITNNNISQKIEKAVFLQNKIAYYIIILSFLLLIFPFFLYDILRIGYATPIDYNEGWNVIHTSRLLDGGLLYLPVNNGLPITPVNYPPLSFIIIGALSYFTGSILQTGRVISLISIVSIGYLIFKIIDNFTFKKLAALSGALLWIALMVRMASCYVGMYDPQVLAHVFSIGAFYFYSKWIDRLTPQKIFILALLCCLGLFTKHLLIAIPISLAITLFFANKRHFSTFALAGIIFFSLMLLGSWLYEGKYFFSNFIDFNLPYSKEQVMNSIAHFLNNALFVLFLPFIILFLKFQKRWMFVLIYFSFSFLLGVYVRGAGVDINAWFDFFIAAAIILGLLVAELPKLKVFWMRIVAYGIIASCFLPFSISLKDRLNGVLTYDTLKNREEAYLKDVVLLRSIEGPALFEELLIGFDSRKPFLFDPCAGSMLIVSGRIPEKILTDPIRKRYFGAIVLDFNLDKKLSNLNEKNISSEPKNSTMTIWIRWTDNILKTISDNYKLYDLKRPSNYFFYLPKYTLNK